MALHWIFWILSQPPAFEIYDANAHWHTHQLTIGQSLLSWLLEEPLFPVSHREVDEHQSGCPVTVQKFSSVDDTSIQMWCDPESSSLPIQDPFLVYPVRAIFAFGCEHGSNSSPYTFVYEWLANNCRNWHETRIAMMLHGKLENRYMPPCRSFVFLSFGTNNNVNVLTFVEINYKNCSVSKQQTVKRYTAMNSKIIFCWLMNLLDVRFLRILWHCRYM